MDNRTKKRVSGGGLVALAAGWLWKWGGHALAIIGLGGVMDDLKIWSDWINALGPYGLLITGLALIVWSFLPSARRGNASMTQTPFSELAAYFQDMTKEAEALLSRPDINNKMVIDWRDKLGKAIRTALGADKEREFLQSNLMTAEKLYPSPEGAKNALNEYLATLKKIIKETTSYDLASSFDPADLKQYL